MVSRGSTPGGILASSQAEHGTSDQREPCQSDELIRRSASLHTGYSQTAMFTLLEHPMLHLGKGDRRACEIRDRCFLLLRRESLRNPKITCGLTLRKQAPTGPFALSPQAGQPHIAMPAR